MRMADGIWQVVRENADHDRYGIVRHFPFYYGKRTDVNAAVERGLAWISKNQLESGGFGTQGVETSESVAQILVHFPDSALTEARMHIF